MRCHTDPNDFLKVQEDVNEGTNSYGIRGLLVLMGIPYRNAKLPKDFQGTFMLQRSIPFVTAFGNEIGRS